MKKLALLLILAVFLSMNFTYATKNLSIVETKTVEQNAFSNDDGNFFSVLKTKITKKVTKIKKIFDNWSKKLKNYTQSLRTAIIIMAVGLIFLILASAGIGGGIVWAVGAIFFLVGAVLLLLEIL